MEAELVKSGGEVNRVSREEISVDTVKRVITCIQSDQWICFAYQYHG